MQKIKVLVPLLIGNTYYRTGQIADAPDDRARWFIDIGLADPVEAKKRKPKNINLHVNATVNGMPVEVETMAIEPEKETAVVAKKKTTKKKTKGAG